MRLKARRTHTSEGMALMPDTSEICAATGGPCVTLCRTLPWLPQFTAPD